MEKIISSAVRFRFKNGIDYQILCDKFHADIYSKIHQISKIFPIDEKSFVDGFYTNTNQFISRQAGFRLAVENKQILRDSPLYESGQQFLKNPTIVCALRAEDLWESDF